jgi:hypothetical protein
MLKSGDSTMLSSLSPRRPCCGPKAADLRRRTRRIQRVRQVRKWKRMRNHAPAVSGARKAGSAMVIDAKLRLHGRRKLMHQST